MRLIDGDALMHEANSDGAYGYVDAKQISEAPTIDAVPVIRCQECKHHRDKNEQEQQYLVEDILICTCPYTTDYCWNAVWPNHFCSYGERKEDEE